MEDGDDTKAAKDVCSGRRCSFDRRLGRDGADSAGVFARERWPDVRFRDEADAGR